MDLNLILLASVDGVSYASLLFLISLGLTLICGVFGVINVAHGSLYAFGGYSAATLLAWLAPHTSSTPVMILALFVAAIVVGGALGMLLERGLLRYFQERDPILQLLVTFAAFMVLEDLQRMIWGSTPVSAGDLAGRMGTLELGGVTFMNYQLLFVPGVALAAYAGLQFLLRHSLAGRQIVTVIHNREVATALGINAARVGTLTFGLAGALGALGGALSIPMTSFVPGLGAEMIVTSFAVIATAGLGQITGALVASLLIGLARAMVVYVLPELEVVMPYLMMVAVLLVRPHGLFSVTAARRI
ncbi:MULTISPECIES: branched-chain amino acid ABC transporter permease [unclassified Achromobacter]|uniref:branched-chain amino acid ABC transporter permease n=1 Tax=unclassified Achromobacter TaxID=2626865 RepID=UPI000B51A9C5|nr:MULTISPECIES: branched-chain amino acid ABC transporter permease [unclassified Achromobacter]OWT80839.1 branched-chain amino acid ABC transporter permease [Achromobacter sp. HZ34]OWT81355.1 branched-chain amino acid ABC transporter permease [Achromobacter sp. HZ28]